MTRSIAGKRRRSPALQWPRSNATPAPIDTRTAAPLRVLIVEAAVTRTDKDFS